MCVYTTPLAVGGHPPLAVGGHGGGGGRVAVGGHPPLAVGGHP
jgi:hypothetical protein